MQAVIPTKVGIHLDLPPCTQATLTRPLTVTPANAGVQFDSELCCDAEPLSRWIPSFVGMTVFLLRIVVAAGMSQGSTLSPRALMPQRSPIDNENFPGHQWACAGVTGMADLNSTRVGIQLGEQTPYFGKTLACISHTHSTAAAHTLVMARAAPSCRLDVVLATPAPSLSPPHAPRRRLDRLATNGYEKCRLGFRRGNA